MPNYEITINVHVPDELAALLQAEHLRIEAPGRQALAVSEDTETAPPQEAEPVQPPAKAAGPVTVADAKAAVIAWAEQPGENPATATELLVKNFGVKLKEIDESQAAAIHAFFTEGAA